MSTSSEGDWVNSVSDTSKDCCDHCGLPEWSLIHNEGALYAWPDVHRFVSEREREAYQQALEREP